MNALATLTRTEARLIRRDPAALSMSLIMPGLLVVVLGFAIPVMREPQADIGGQRPIDLYVPILITLAILTTGLTTVPTTLTTYRERGVLRRLATTPVPPIRIVLAHLAVAVGITLAAVVLAIVAGVVSFGTPLPEAPLTAVLALAVGIAGIFALGLLIAAVSKRVTTSTGIGTIVYFPMLFLAGVWTPGPVMPDAVEVVQPFTPAGALTRALGDAWAGGAFPALELVVLVAYAIGLTALSARLFRWS